MLTKQTKLNRVVESVDQLVSVTIELLGTDSNNPAKQILNTVKINELRLLQKMVHKISKKSHISHINEERVWRIITILINIVLEIAKTVLSKSIIYHQCHEMFQEIAYLMA